MKIGRSLFFFLIFSFIALTDCAAAEKQKRFLTAALFLDDCLAERDEDKGVITDSFIKALGDGVGTIFVSATFLYNFLRDKGDTEINKLFSAWEIYIPADKTEFEGSMLFLFINRQYKKEKMNEVKQLDVEQALGLLLKHEDIVRRVGSVDELKALRQKGITGEQKRSVPFLKKVFLKNKDLSFGGAWIFFFAGHGGESLQSRGLGAIASISIEKDYPDFITFMQNFMSVEVVFVFSCYSGGFNALMSLLGIEGLKITTTDFSIIHWGGNDAATYGSIRVKSLLDNMIKKTIDSSVKLREVVISMLLPDDVKRMRQLIETGKSLRRKYAQYFYASIPFVRFPRTKQFIPINIFPDLIEIVTHTKSVAHQLKIVTGKRRRLIKEQTPIVIDDKKRMVLISPSILQAPLKILNSKNPPAIFSVFPGSSIHFLSELDLSEKPCNLLRFLNDAFFVPAYVMRGAARKIFVIKKMKFKERGGMVKELHNVIVAMHSIGEGFGRTVVGDLYFEEQPQKGGIFSTSYKWKYSYERGRRKLKLQERYRDKTYKKNIFPRQAFVMIRDIIGAREHIPFVEAKAAPLLPGQQDYRYLVSYISEKLMNNVWDEKTGPWRFLWSNLYAVSKKQIEARLTLFREELAKAKLQIKRFFEVIRSNKPLSLIKIKPAYLNVFDDNGNILINKIVALDEISASKKISIIEEFMRQGAKFIWADKAGRKALDIAISRGDTELFKFFIKNGFEQSSQEYIVRAAVDGGSVYIVKWVLDKFGKDMDWSIRSLLFNRAVQNGHLDIIKFLFEKWNGDITRFDIIKAIKTAKDKDYQNVIQWLGEELRKRK